MEVDRASEVGVVGVVGVVGKAGEVWVVAFNFR